MRVCTRTAGDSRVPVDSANTRLAVSWRVMRRLLIPVLFVLVAAACTSVTPVADTSTSTITSTTTAPVETPTTLNPEQQHERVLRAQIDELIGTTAQLRELEFLSPPTVTLVDDAELADRVRRLIREDIDPDEVARDTALEELLGLIPAGTDVMALYEDLYSEQVLGFYDGKTKELVVPSNEETLSDSQKVTLVHELTHALTDQHFGFSDLADKLDEEQRYDALSALQTITEGDATLTELHYVASLPRDVQQRIVAESLDQDTTVFDRAPRFIQDLLVFPYNTGFGLLNGLWSPTDGYSLIDDAYTNPPQTTEQVMHPAKFRDREPAIPVTLPDTPIDGYQNVEESTWGELLFKVMFDQVLGADVAGTAAAGWGGDRYRLLWDGDNVAFAILYIGDTEQDAIEMQDALLQYATAAMRVTSAQGDGRGVHMVDGDYMFVARSGDQVVFVAAGDPEIGTELRQAFPEF